LNLRCIRFECVVTHEFALRGKNGAYELPAILHGALGREMHRYGDSRLAEMFESKRTLNDAKQDGGPFNTPPPPIGLGRMFVLAQENRLVPGELFAAELFILGGAPETVREVIECFALAGAHGIGRPSEDGGLRGGFAVLDVLECGYRSIGSEAAIFRNDAFAAGCSVEFLSPLSLKWLSPEATPAFSDLMKACHERLVKSLWASYGQGAHPFSFSPEASRRIKLQSGETCVERWAKHLGDGSARPGGAPYAGCIGWASYVGDIRPFLSPLFMACRVGIGQGSAMGLGRLLIRPFGESV